ncbi:hypothetical protein NS334_03750 [Sphingomonas endophytica]|uniref:3-keto-alpha-glucoside-1,2-lyase/3-keto-2-hydroxy-glucal hydratase domain-containing protein n=2 Tax=Sphingomonas endophytica TaxID=869719 RepID=A0A147I7M7_9SPHN|nr:hypothetical protein NS334_03750 [Sphingomonas endophytica]
MGAMKGIVLGTGLLLAASASVAQTPEGDPKATEQWSPAVPVVTPGAFAGWAAPADAIVLFDGKGLDQWSAVNTGGAAGWTVANGAVTVKKGTGNIQTKRTFGSYQLHLEYRIPAGITGEGQARGNSGLFLASTGKGDEGYELQIMDSYNNPTYVNGQLGAVYKQTPPLANPARKPGEWQTVDVTWSAPQFGADGTVTRPAFVTAYVNGVLVQNHTELRGATTYIGQPKYTAHGKASIKLQDHGDPSAPISFRNIWVRDLPD